MKRRDFLKALGVGAAASTLPNFQSCGAFGTSRKPNYLFVLVDDLGWADIGCYGSSFYETPNIDRLASQGMRFTNAYAASPVCSPTRASIMTGKHPARLNITDWIPGDRPTDRKLLGPKINNELPLQEITIAETLRGAGYKTFFAGKWHLGDEGYFPEDQGFDINKGGHSRGSPPGGYYSPYNNPKLQDGPEGEYLPDRLTNESIQFLDNHCSSDGDSQDQPFMLFLSFYTVHTPIQASKRHLKKFEDKLSRMQTSSEEGFRQERKGWTKLQQDDPTYASMIYAMDENVGRILKKLDDLSLSDDTVVIFMSDNGGLSTLGRKWSPTSNVPLRAGKGWCYEGGIREPMIIRAPGVTSAGHVCETPVTSMDFYPTMLDLAGIDPVPDQHIDGLSLKPLLSEKKDLDRKILFWHFPHYHGSKWTPGSALREGDWKLVRFYEEDKSELYNIRNDISEEHDLAQSNPEKLKELETKLDSCLENCRAQMPIANSNWTGS
ncbi:sulfatase-like hydrolase/transferase [candidate division KSB1 bacterium]